MLLTRWLFLRLLGGIYLVAFLSLWLQIDGLHGSQGILPIAQFLKDLRAGSFPIAYYQLPTLFWLGASDEALHAVGAGGALCSVLVIVGIVPAPALGGAWLAYLSFVNAGQEFLSFQWDALLLETGFLAIFLAPWQLWPSLARETPPSEVMTWLVRWLLFRLMFESGCVKLLSGDRTWRDLTALQYHYWTQPLPTWLAWHANQLPESVNKTCVALLFVVELAVPFLIALGRRPRQIAFAANILLQLAILLTGNYGFFNWLTIVLAIPLLDDAALWPFVPSGQKHRLRFASPGPAESWIKRAWIATVAGIVLLMGGFDLARMVARQDLRAEPFLTVIQFIEPFRIVNRYGLFAVMTTTRPEIIIEGSNDGEHWQAYEFPYKPGDVKRRPLFVAPYHPRLDWQMWFAALGDYRENPWLIQFLIRLHEGAPAVLRLLQTNPFPDRPPRYLRAMLYDYEFTDAAARRTSGAWWHRTEQGAYCPMLGP